MTDRDSTAPRPTPPRHQPLEVRHAVTHEELISIAGIAELTGTKPSTVRSWSTRFGKRFPEAVENPDRAHHRMVFFNKQEVLDFLRENRLGKEFAEGGEVRRGRQSASDGVFYRTNTSASRPSNSSSAGPRVRSAAEFAPRFDAIATIGLADAQDERAQALIADLMARADAAVRDRPTPADARAFNDILLRLGAHIADHAPQYRDLVWRGVTESDVLGADPRTFADNRFARWTARIGRERSTTALEEFEELAKRFRRSPSPWSHRPLDSPSVITETLWQLTPTRPMRMLDLTCGIGSAAIPALKAGIDVIGCDREAADVRVARQWAALLERDEQERRNHWATARFEVRDRLTDFKPPSADFVLLSDPSADSAELGRPAGTRYWLGTQLRIKTALGHVNGAEGRAMLVLPTHMLDPNTESDIGTEAQMLARDTRTDWSRLLEAVIEMPTSRLPLNTTILIFHGEHARPQKPILFATMPSEFREIDVLMDAFAELRNSDTPDVERLQRHIGGRAALVPREVIANSNGNLTPTTWWRAEFAKNPDRVNEVLRADRNRIVSSISQLHEAIRAFEKLDISAKETDGEPIVWRPFTELADAGFITQIAPAATDARTMSAVRDGREPIHYPGRASAMSPFAMYEPHIEARGVRGRSQLLYGDVVYWMGRDTIHARVVSSPESAVLLNPGRGIRLLTAGRDEGLTPELLAFAIEASGASVERAASRRAFDSLRFPARDDKQPISDAAAWFARRFQDVSAASEALRALEAKAADIVLAARDMRRDAGIFGSASAISARSDAPPREHRS